MQILKKCTLKKQHKHAFQAKHLLGKFFKQNQGAQYISGKRREM